MVRQWSKALLLMLCGGERIRKTKQLNQRRSVKVPKAQIDGEKKDTFAKTGLTCSALPSLALRQLAPDPQNGILELDPLTAL